MYQAWRKVYGRTQMSGAGFIVPAGGGGSSLLTNLAASWKLDGLTDASGNGNTLTNNGTVSFANAGKIGNAATFVSTSSQYLSLASNSYVQTGDVDWTIGCWVYCDSTADAQLVTKDTDTSREYGLILASVEFQFGVFVGGAFKSAQDSPTGGLTTAAWHSVIGWHDSVNDLVWIQVDDRTAVSAATTGAADAAGAAQFRIGARQYPTIEGYFNGRIDNVNIWKRILTSGERADFYNSGTGKEHPFT